MKKIFFVSALLLTSSGFAYNHSFNFEGNYNCRGTEIGTHASYQCEMYVKKTGNTYAYTSSCNDGTSYTGTGIYDHKTKQISVGFTNPKKKEEIGVALVHVKSDGSLSSTWTYLNKSELSHSTCIPMKKVS